MAESVPKARILCTEDDPDTRELLAFTLGAEGFEVVGTDSPDEAIRRAKTESFDLFLVDNWMPGMSGAQLTGKLREFNIKTPILFCSGAAQPKDKDEARSAGAQGYLVKPVDMADLIDEVVKLIAEARIAYPVDIVVP